MAVLSLAIRYSVQCEQSNTQGLRIIDPCCCSRKNTSDRGRLRNDLGRYSHVRSVWHSAIPQRDIHRHIDDSEKDDAMSGPRKYSEAYHAETSCAGRSIIDMMKDKLDAAMRRYLEEPNDQRRGVVRGLAMGVAIIQQPYNPNAKAVERESKGRVT